MPFAYATAVKQRRYMKAVEKIVNLVKNTNISLCLGGDLGMVRVGSFLLILLYILGNSL